MDTAATTRIALLQTMPVFGAIREDALQFLLDRSRTVSIRASEFFFHEHQQADSMLVLESGSASAFKSWQGRDFVLHTLKSGDCFGEMALMDLAARSASVRAEQPCCAIEFSAANLHALFDYDAEQFALIQMNIGREVCRRLRATDELLFRAQMGEAICTQGARLIFSARAG